MFDLKITGGTIVDGTGRAPFAGDVAVQGGRIAGSATAPARRAARSTRAARTCCPASSTSTPTTTARCRGTRSCRRRSLHGVTTCVMGSCGVGFAPVRPGREATLVELMEGVEDIPGSALAEGIPWGWESFADYMDVIGAMPHAIDFLVQVPHDPLRMYVMGERAVAERGRDRRRHRRDARRCSARRSRPARRASRPAAATTTAPRAARRRRPPRSTRASSPGSPTAFRGLGHGVLQAVSDFDMMRGPDRFDPEFDLLEQMAAASGGRPLSISTMQRDHAPNQWRQILARAERAVERGLDVRCQVGARGIGVLLGLEATFHPFMGFPSYKAIAHLPLAERVARMRDPELRARILAETSDKVAGDGTPIPPLADFFLANLEMVAMRLYPMARAPGLRADARSTASPPRRAAPACRCSRASTTRCSRTTARRCSTSRSTTTRA